MTLKRFFYQMKPLLPRCMQIYLRRVMVYRKVSLCNGFWPIDIQAGIEPLGWEGWPEEKRFALILTHDVEKGIGQDRCLRLAEIEERLGFVSSFNFVPQRYVVSAPLREHLTRRGFEVGVHDYNHDGKLFDSHKIFSSRSRLINRCLDEWNAVGFRAAAMHHNLNWISELNLEYDCSTFDTDPFEPQPDGVGTIFPFWVAKGNQGGFVELPYTLPQDFTLFILMKHETTEIWKQKLEWIVEKGGMALLNVHPDYINFDYDSIRSEEYPLDYYRDFLLHVKKKYANQYWNVLPRDIAQLTKARRLSKGANKFSLS
jgi:hypothetical protein